MGLRKPLNYHYPFCSRLRDDKAFKAVSFEKKIEKSRRVGEEE